MEWGLVLVALVGLLLGWAMGALVDKVAQAVREGRWLVVVTPLLLVLVVLWLALAILRPLVGA